MNVRYLALITAFFLILNIPLAMAFSTSTDLEVTGDHYVNARSLQQEKGYLSITNISKIPLTNINVETDAETLTINNSCQSGLLPNQSCTVTYIFHAGNDLGKEHNEVSSKLEHLKISYQKANEIYQEFFYVVTNHIDSLRLLSLPMSRSSFHNIASSQTKDITYDTNTHTIYVASARGLSISNDGGNNWQTLTPFNSLLNDKSDITTIEASSPKFTYIDQDKIYVVLSNYITTDENLMVSTDHGATWSSLNKINGSFEIAAKNNDIYIAKFYGLDISHDGGKSWQTKFFKKNIFSVKLDEKAVYIGTNYGMQVSYDKGETFSPIPGNSTICNNSKNFCSVKKIKLIDNNIYALVSDNYTSTKLIKGDAQGFKPILSLGMDDRCDYAAQEQYIIAGCYSQLLQVSKDAGQTWHNVSNYDFSMSSHPGNGIVLIPKDNNIQTMILSATGLPAISNDFGETWKKLSVGIFAEYEMRNLIANKSGILMISTSKVYLDDSRNKMSSIGISKDDGITWQPIFSTNYSSAIQYPNIFVANDNFYYFESLPADRLYHSDKNAENWSFIETPSIAASIKIDSDGTWYTINNFFDRASNLDKANIMISKDQGKSWYADGPVIDNHLNNIFKIIPGSQVTLLSVTNTSYDTQNTDLYLKIKEQGSNWKKISFPNLYSTGLASEDKNIYLLISPSCLNCHQPAYLYVSQDIGNTWTKQKLSLPGSVGSQPLLLGVKSGKIYLTLPDTSHSIFYDKIVMSNDNGKNWVDLGGLITPMYTLTGLQRINAFTFTDKEFYIATGVGLYSFGNIDIPN